MEVGRKIRQLRIERQMSQQKLAADLDISQSRLHHIESDKQQKIDFVLMDKICNIFDKDLSYFINDNVTNNNVKENSGQISCKISCENVTVNNNYPESILTEIQQLIDENKLLKAEIAALKGKKA